MTPIGTGDEQSLEERLEIARRYRKRRGAELRELAGRCVDGVEAAGQFSSVPIESMAAVPMVGTFMALWARARSKRRSGLPADLLIALTPQRVHALGVRANNVTAAEPAVAEVGSWPREQVSVASVRPRFMRSEVAIDTGEEKPLILYVSSLRTNPWSAEIVRALGGEAPEPLDLTG